MADLHALRCPREDTGRLLRERWDAGEAAVVLPPDAPDPAIAAMLDVLRPAVLTDVTEGRSTSRPLTDPLPIDDEVAVVVATSGSTGRPKGVELTHAALHASTTASLRRLNCSPGDRWALALPTHHVAGLQVLLRAWACGTEAEPVDRAELAATGATHVSLVPTQLQRLLDDRVDLTRFATILLGGARIDTRLLARAQDAGAHIVRSYGMSETAGGCVYDGLPLDGVEVEVVGQRIRIRGPVLLRGYRNDPGATQDALDAEGWFTTGDLGRLAGGHLEVLGRADDVVVSGGENVALQAVTDALLGHADVLDAATTSRPDRDWGEVVVALVVPRDPHAPPTLTMLADHVAMTLPASHVPRELHLVPALPRDGMGKVTRAGLDDALGTGV